MTARTLEAEALTDLFLEVFRVTGGLLGEGDRLTRDFGQTSARWQVLGALRNGPDTVAGIARQMGRARQSVQRTADLLAAEGLVEYFDNPAHRRAQLVRLSSTGTTALAGITARQADWTNGLAERMAVDEGRIREALTVLRALRSELERPRRASGSRSGDPRDRTSSDLQKEEGTP